MTILLKRVTGSWGDGQGSRWAQHRAAMAMETVLSGEREGRQEQVLSARPARISVTPGHTEEHTLRGADTCVQYIMMRGPYNIFCIKGSKSDLHFRNSRLWDTCKG